jgi:transposase
MTTEALLAENHTLKQTVAQQGEALKNATLLIDKLKLELSYLKRMRYGQASEKLDHDGQLELMNSSLAPVPAANDPAQPKVTDIDVHRGNRKAKRGSAARELPEHLPRRTVVHQPAGGCTCDACGVTLREIGQDVSEMLEYEPGNFHVIRHVRPKLACGGCQTIHQADAPSRPIERGLPGPGLLAHVLVSKYTDHLPLYRQSQIYAREGVMLERSTLCDWVAGAAKLLTPLALAVGRYVLQAAKVHSDDTPTRTLGAGKGAAHLGRLWAYVRDDRASADTAPPAVWFQYSANRKGEHPQAHLRNYSGILQVDAFSGYNGCFEDGRIIEAACWAHARRKHFEIHKQMDQLPGTLAHQALQRIARIYAVEADIRGRRCHRALSPAVDGRIPHPARPARPDGPAAAALAGRTRGSGAGRPGTARAAVDARVSREFADSAGVRVASTGRHPARGRQDAAGRGGPAVRVKSVSPEHNKEQTWTWDLLDARH